MGHVFQRIDDDACVLDFGAAVGAIANMGFQGLNPEAHLVVEEEIDLVRKQVPVIHGVTDEDYGAAASSVSTEEGRGKRTRETRVRG
jgi:hypothetical protein